MPFFNARTSKIDTNVVVSVTSDISSAFCLLHGFVIVTPPQKKKKKKRKRKKKKKKEEEKEEEEKDKKKNKKKKTMLQHSTNCLQKFWDALHMISHQTPNTPTHTPHKHKYSLKHTNNDHVLYWIIHSHQAKDCWKHMHILRYFVTLNIVFIELISLQNYSNS